MTFRLFMILWVFFYFAHLNRAGLNIFKVQFKVFDARTQNGGRGNLSFAPNGYSRQWNTFLLFWQVAWGSWYSSPTHWDFENSESLSKTVRSPDILYLALFLYTYLSHECLRICDCCVYKHALNFCVSVLMLLATPGGFCSTIFPTQAFEIQPVSKASSKVTFSGRSPQVLQEEFLPFLCVSGSTPAPSYPHQAPYWTEHSPAFEVITG